MEVSSTSARVSPTSFVVGLGSNLGSRIDFLRAAVDALSRVDGVRVEAISHLYETAAVGPPQPDYLNAAVRISTTLRPHALLRETSRIESDLGRRRGERWGPRTLDLDLLSYDGPPVATAELTLPHPALLSRPFALAPLLDVLDRPAPEFRRALAALGGAPVVRRPFEYPE